MDWKERFWSKVDVGPPGSCWRWTAGTIGRGRYGIIKVNGLATPATHASLALDNRPRPDSKAYALHSCDNPSCVNPGHLRWGSQADNMADRAERGRSDARKGSEHHAAKLTEDDVRFIRKSDLSSAELAKSLGVKEWTVSKARRGISWRHLPVG